MHRSLAAAAIVLLLTACSRRDPPPPPPAFEATPTVLPLPATAPRVVPVPADEPSEVDVVRLYVEEIDAVRAAGGLPLVVTATGTRMTVMPTLHGAWKDDCRRVPQSAPGHWECSLTVKLALERVDPEGAARRRGTNEPSLQGARIFARWDAAAGRWVRG